MRLLHPLRIIQGRHKLTSATCHRSCAPFTSPAATSRTALTTCFCCPAAVSSTSVPGAMLLSISLDWDIRAPPNPLHRAFPVRITLPFLQMKRVDLYHADAHIAPEANSAVQ